MADPVKTHRLWAEGLTAVVILCLLAFVMLYQHDRHARKHSFFSCMRSSSEYVQAAEASRLSCTTWEI